MTRLSRWLAAALVAMMFLPQATRAQSGEYRVSAGDTLSVAVMGYPDLTRKTIVGAGGEIVLPFVGGIAAAGKTLDEVRGILADRLKEKQIVHGAQISLEVIDYAPFYVSGDVAKPGSFPFRPGMTVRHAIAVAGGLGNRTDEVSSMDLWSRERTETLAHIKAQARMLRLQADLDGADTVDFSPIAIAPSDRRLFARIAELELQQFAARRQDREREAAHLKAALAMMLAQIRTLETQRQSEAANLAAMTAEYDRVQAAFRRGIIAATRIAEALQSASLVRARLSAVVMQISDLQRSAAELERKAQRFADSEKLKTLAEMQDALIEVEVVASRLRVARENRSRGPGATARNIDVRIFRNGDRIGVEANESAPISSGDVIDIRVGPEDRANAMRPVGRVGGPD